MPDIQVRPAIPADVPEITAMVHELAAYERAPDQCQLTADQLHESLFGARPAVFSHVAVRPDAPDRPVGFALWFLNYSTWAGTHGIYLEDLYVRPEARGSGAGRRLLAELAATCVARGYRRLDWWVLHWNPAREFYHAFGAEAMDEWVPYRLSGAPMERLATEATEAGEPDSDGNTDRSPGIKGIGQAPIRRPITNSGEDRLSKA